MFFNASISLSDIAQQTPLIHRDWPTSIHRFDLPTDIWNVKSCILHITLLYMVCQTLLSNASQTCHAIKQSAFFFLPTARPLTNRIPFVSCYWLPNEKRCQTSQLYVACGGRCVPEIDNANTIETRSRDSIKTQEKIITYLITVKTLI